MPKGNNERQLLHDISSPLTCLQLNLEKLTKISQETATTDQEVRSKKILENCLRQVEKMSELVRNRREKLKKEMERKEAP